VGGLHSWLAVVTVHVPCSIGRVRCSAVGCSAVQFVVCTVCTARL
jgi:hypothetical protein